MVLAFFRGGASDGGFDSIVAKSVGMLGDARHSFDLATLALLTDADPATVAQDIRDTDQRINEAEHELRSELVVHVSVQGSYDIGSVLGFTLLVKKIERIGDQAKSILELAETGVKLTESSEIDELLEGRQTTSSFFTEASALLSNPDSSAEEIEEYAGRVVAKMDDLQAKIDGFMNSERPGSEVVPLAIYYRYVLRTVANLLGVVRTAAEPLPNLDDVSGTDEAGRDLDPRED